MIQVINLCKDTFDLRKKFLIDETLFKKYEDLNHKVESFVLDDTSYLIKVNNHENYYFLLDNFPQKNLNEFKPNSINIFEITPTIDQIRLFHHLVLEQEGQVSIVSKIK